MITVLTWYWKQPGGRTEYTASHVNTWAAMIRRNLTMPHRVACVTDIPEGIDRSIDIIEPPREFEGWSLPTWSPRRPQCLRRLVMFAPDAGRIFGDRFVCMDLDCVIAGPLDPLFSGDPDFRMCKGTARGNPYNGSMMLLRAGSRPQVYQSLTPEGAILAGKRYVGSDQAWISHILGTGEATWGPEHGVFTYRLDARRPWRDCRVMFFPGQYKPWLLAADRLKREIAAHYHDGAADLAQAVA